MLHRLIDSVSLGVHQSSGDNDKVILDSTSVGVSVRDVVTGNLIDSMSIGITPESELEDLRTNIISIS